MNHRQKEMINLEKLENPLKSIKRIFGYINKSYKKELIISVVSIIINTIVGVVASLYLETLIDKYIVPLIGVPNPEYLGLIKGVGTLIVLYLIGVITIHISTRVMVKISEGTLKIIRDEMFIKMQKLPIKYFDTHTHGDIMSRYTNDTDTLSQMISQSLPQVFVSGITILFVFIAMIIANIYLTLTVIVSLIVMLFITKKVAGGSAKYFIKRQEAVGKVNRIYRGNDTWTKSCKSILP